MTTKIAEIFSKQALDSLPDTFTGKVIFYRKYAEKLAQGKPETLFEVVGGFVQFKEIEAEISLNLRKQGEVLFGEYVLANRQMIEKMRLDLAKSLTRVGAK